MNTVTSLIHTALSNDAANTIENIKITSPFLILSVILLWFSGKTLKNSEGLKEKISVIGIVMSLFTLSISASSLLSHQLFNFGFHATTSSHVEKYAMSTFESCQKTPCSIIIDDGLIHVSGPNLNIDFRNENMDDVYVKTVGTHNGEPYAFVSVGVGGIHSIYGIPLLDFANGNILVTQNGIEVNKHDFENSIPVEKMKD